MYFNAMHPKGAGEKASGVGATAVHRALSTPPCETHGIADGRIDTAYTSRPTRRECLSDALVGEPGGLVDCSLGLNGVRRADFGTASWNFSSSSMSPR